MISRQSRGNLIARSDMSKDNVPREELPPDKTRSDSNSGSLLGYNAVGANMGDRTQDDANGVPLDAELPSYVP